jgi:hypothetical protein
MPCSGCNRCIPSLDDHFQVFSAGHAGQSIATYRGTLTGDVIKGSVEIAVADKKFSTPWEVRREAGKP